MSNADSEHTPDEENTEGTQEDKPVHVPQDEVKKILSYCGDPDAEAKSAEIGNNYFAGPISYINQSFFI